MMGVVVLAAAKVVPPPQFAVVTKSLKSSKLEKECKLQSWSTKVLCSPNRRDILLVTKSFFTVTMLSCIFRPSKILAAEKSTMEDVEEDKGIFGAIESLFDPNEKSKSGKVLPKAYLKSARDVVKNLRESLKEDPKDIAKFRRTADAAKESIRDYLGNWRGQASVAQEESYVMLERAIRALASFYSKAGPSAPLPYEVRSEILDDLNSAEGFL